MNESLGTIFYSLKTANERSKAVERSSVMLSLLHTVCVATPGCMKRAFWEEHVGSYLQTCQQRRLQKQLAADSSQDRIKTYWSGIVIFFPLFNLLCLSRVKLSLK